jgi:hypothetical protein
MLSVSILRPLEIRYQSMLALPPVAVVHGGRSGTRNCRTIRHASISRETSAFTHRCRVANAREGPAKHNSSGTDRKRWVWFWASARQLGQVGSEFPWS